MVTLAVTSFGEPGEARWLAVRDSAARAYDDYFASGHYDRRYPSPNPRAMRLIEETLAVRRPDAIIDLGSGSGRYALPLLARHGMRLIAVDPSATARSQLLQRAEAQGVAERLSVYGSTQEVPLEASGGTMVIAMFGVLSYIIGDRERHATLVWAREAIGPNGVAIVSVPNRIRRFLPSQARLLLAGERGHTIRYSRRMVGPDISFAYRLFTPAKLTTEFRAAGLEPLSLRCECLLPERVVSSREWAGRVDALFSGATPSAVGYGLLVCATRGAESVS